MLCGVRGSGNTCSLDWRESSKGLPRKNMGEAVLHPHSMLHLPSFSAFSTRPKFGKSFLTLKDGPLISSIRADENRERPRKKASLEDNPRSSFSPNKEEILAVFKRIQSSISKGGTIDSKKRISKAAEDNKASAESILEVLEQSRTRPKGRTPGQKGDTFWAPRKDSLKKEEKTELSSTIGLKPTRPPSAFTRRSPIPTPSIRRDQVLPKSEKLSPTQTLSIMRGEVEQKNGSLRDDSDQQSKKFEEMKLHELKEVVKSKGIKGYSKLKKSELVELLVRSLNDTSL